MAKALTSEEFEPAAKALVDRLLAENPQVPTEPRVLLREGELTWNSDTLEYASEHAYAVLGRSDDFVVFFDNAGKVMGWRDDGRTGVPKPQIIDRDAAREAIARELDLPPTTRLGQLVTAELKPFGWTHQVVVFLKDPPADADVLRVWLSPKDLKIIQCLYGPVPATSEKK